MPFAVALLHHPAGIYAFVVAAIVGSLYAAQRPAFVPAFAGVAAALLALLGFLAVPPSSFALPLLGIGVVLLHVEFLFPTSGAAGMLGLGATISASCLLLAPGAPPAMSGAARLALAVVGTLVLFGVVARTMRLRTLPKN